MVQEAIITKLLPNNMAEVAVVRASACGKNCSSCESCVFQNELKVVAKNHILSTPGHKVLIETESSKIFGAAILVYLFPMIAMIAGYILAASAAFSELLCVFFGFVGLAAGFVVVILVHKKIKSNKPISYTIVKELT